MGLRKMRKSLELIALSDPKIKLLVTLVLVTLERAARLGKAIVGRDRNVGNSSLYGMDARVWRGLTASP